MIGFTNRELDRASPRTGEAPSPPPGSVPVSKQVDLLTRLMRRQPYAVVGVGIALGVVLGWLVKRR